MPHVVPRKSRSCRPGRMPGNLIVKPPNVLTEADELLVYEADALTLHKQLPAAVVIPRNAEEVAAAVAFLASPRAGQRASWAVLAPVSMCTWRCGPFNKAASCAVAC